MLLLGVLQAQAAGGVVVDSDFDLLETQVLDSAELSVTFSSLSTYAADYQHLQLRIVASGVDSDNLGEVGLQFNGVTAATYSSHLLFGTGGQVYSGNNLSETSIHAADIARTNTAEIFGSGVIDILDPFETSKNKTTRSLTGMFINATAFRHFISVNSGLWPSTDAVSSLTLLHRGGQNFAIGSRFSLYGIKAGS
jgi:hypothetical protein